MAVDEKRIVAVSAPIAGIFYRSASEHDPPYVQLGSQVSPKQILGLLETMKVFSKVRSPVQGIVVEILPANAQAVARGQVIFRIQLT